MSDDVTRDLAAAAAQPRDDASAPAAADDLPVAATVVVLRDAPGGAEALLIHRPDRGSFAGAWVFPGGKLEPSDEGDDEEAAARAAAIRETWEETGLRLAPDALHAFARWEPPPGIALRIRTWFFLARDTGTELALADAEAVGAMWARPADVLARHSRGELTLYPPTWVTLHELSGGGVDALLVRADREALRTYETALHHGGHGTLLLWREDAEYDAAAAGGSARHRLDVSALPWVYTRAD